MKLKTLAVAIASVGAIAAANYAAAIAPSEIAGANLALRPDVTLFMSGATAKDNALKAYVQSLCNPAQSLTMSNQATSPGNSQSGYFCELTGAAAADLSLVDTTGDGVVRVLVYKRSSGGSAWGVGPVVNPSAANSVPRLDPGSCPAVPTSGTHYQCTGTTNDTPEGGISDVEPNLFVGPNLIPNVPEAPTVAGAPGTEPVVDDGGIASFVLDATSFGVQVTTNLRNDLQRVLIAEGRLPGCVIGDETEACMPSLSKAEVASLFGGTMQTWDDFMVGGVSLLAANTAAGGTNPTNTKINLCRRTPGSGTQAQFNALFFNSPCTAGSPPLRDNTSFTSRLNNTTSYGPALFSNIGGPLGTNGVPVGQPAVHEGQGSGDVEGCMSRLNASAISRWGVGFNSLERGFGGSKDYVRFVKVDGISPSLENIANNKYFDWSGSSIQWRTSPYAGAANNVPSTAQLALLQGIRDRAVTITEIDDANDGYPRPAGIDFAFGNLAFPNAAAVPAIAPAFPFVDNNPVMTSQRIAGGKPNTCVTATVINKGAL